MLKKYIRAIIISAICLLTFAVSNTAHAVSTPQQSMFALSPTTAYANIPESRSFFILDGEPAQVIHKSVRVTNVGNATGTVQLSPVDGYTSDQSGAVYHTPAEPKTDIGSWITLPQSIYTLAPKKSIIVPFTIAIPKIVRAGIHLGAIYAANVTPTAALKQQQAGKNTGVLSITVHNVTIDAVQVTTPGTIVQALNATGIEESGTYGRQSLTLALTNTGDGYIYPHGTLTINNANGQQVMNTALLLHTFVPNTSIHYPVPVRNGLATGSYTAVIDLDYGSGKHLHKLFSFSISPAQIAQLYKDTGTTAPASMTGDTTLLYVVIGASAVIVLLLLLVAILLLVSRRRTKTPTPEATHPALSDQLHERETIPHQAMR